MRRWFGIGGALALAGVGLACARGGALVGSNVARPDAAAPSVDARDAPADTVGDTTSDADATPALLGVPLPDGVAPPLRLLDDRATLSGGGRTTCSHAEPASGDGHRWCAFRVPAAAAGATELWVMDVTAAATGAPLVCDGTHPACRRLTKTLWASYGNDFEGDTLIFYADAPAGLKTSETFVGPVYAWRPGWLAAHEIAPHATVCSGSVGGAVAVCLDDPQGTNPSNPDNVLLRVGFLADVADAHLTALPGRWPLRGDGSVSWQLAFSPDGQTFALSVPDADPFTPSLYAIAVRDVMKGLAPTRIIQNVQPWTLSHDGKKVFFYRGPRSDATLYGADFPTGDHELVLATKVVDYLPLGGAGTDTAVLLRVKQTAGGHAYQLLRDRDHPNTATTVFTNEGFLEGIAVSPDLRYTAWVDPNFVGRSIRNSDLATCVLNPRPGPEASDVTFLDDASSLLWSEPVPGGGGARDGFFTPPDDCAARVRYARGLGFLSTVGSRGIIFGDARDELARSVTLKYAAAPLGAAGGTAAAGGVRVHANVTAPVTIVNGVTSATSVHVIYRAATDGAREAGVWLFGVTGL